MAEPRRFVCFRSCALFEVRRIPGITRCSPRANNNKKKTTQTIIIFTFRRFLDRKRSTGANLSSAAAAAGIWQIVGFAGNSKRRREYIIFLTITTAVVTRNSRFRYFFVSSSIQLATGQRVSFGLPSLNARNTDCKTNNCEMRHTNIPT